MLKKRTLAVFTESAYEEVREGRGGPNIGGKGLVHSEHSPSPIKMNCYILSILNLTWLYFRVEKHISFKDFWYPSLLVTWHAGKDANKIPGSSRVEKMPPPYKKQKNSNLRKM